MSNPPALRRTGGLLQGVAGRHGGVHLGFCHFGVECGFPCVGRGVRVEVEALDNERIPTPSLLKDLGRCLTVNLLLLCPVVAIGMICLSTWKGSSWSRTLGGPLAW